MDTTTDDIPGAEPCVTTGAPAYARLHAETRTIHGWYGSAVADLETVVVLDATMPAGPVCDAEITKAIGEGRAVLAEAVTPSGLDAMDDAALRAVISAGVAIAESLLTDPGTAGGLPLWLLRGDEDAMAEPFASHVSGRRTGDGRIDLLASGKLMALLARARGTPLLAGPVRDAAVEAAVLRLREARDLTTSLAALSPA